MSEATTPSLSIGDWRYQFSRTTINRLDIVAEFSSGFGIGFVSLWATAKTPEIGIPLTLVLLFSHISTWRAQTTREQFMDTIVAYTFLPWVSGVLAALGYYRVAVAILATDWLLFFYRGKTVDEVLGEVDE